MRFGSTGTWGPFRSRTRRRDGRSRRRFGEAAPLCGIIVRWVPDCPALTLRASGKGVAINAPEPLPFSRMPGTKWKAVLDPANMPSRSDAVWWPIKRCFAAPSSRWIPFPCGGSRRLRPGMTGAGPSDCVIMQDVRCADSGQRLKRDHDLADVLARGHAPEGRWSVREREPPLIEHRA